MEAAAATCESCGRAPARTIVVRRHVGLIVLQRFVSARVTACRPCGRALIRRFTRTTLWQGWWGAISFFFNFFVLAANANAARQLRAIGDPSLSGDLVTGSPRGFPGVDREPEAPAAAGRRKRRTSPAVYVLLGLVALGLGGWALDAGGPDHEGGHGRPATVPEIEQAMQGPFVADDGSSAIVAGATCIAEEDPVNGGWVHFDCELAYDDGRGEGVVVHLLPNDEIFFESALTGS